SGSGAAIEGADPSWISCFFQSRPVVILIRPRVLAMLEFIKSMFSFSWAMSLFGVHQMVNVLNPSRAMKSFDNVKNAAEKEFDDLTHTTFAAGDNLQKVL